MDSSSFLRRKVSPLCFPFRVELFKSWSSCVVRRQKTYLSTLDAKEVVWNDWPPFISTERRSKAEPHGSVGSGLSFGEADHARRTNYSRPATILSPLVQFQRHCLRLARLPRVLRRQAMVSRRTPRCSPD